jgi:16S rRNA (guanine(527)-N(7))-methyltransferase RsmG
MESKEGLKGLFHKFGIKESSDQAFKLLKYLQLLEKWNKNINLTAKTDWKALAPLFREGIWAAEQFSAKFSRHLDIGSGAGFPAVILNIFFSDSNLEMVESRGKKVAFLETVAYELGLKNVKVHALRLDSMLQKVSIEKKWDCVSWKAIRLADKDIVQLREHAHQDTQFWMFHGREYALETPGILKSLLEEAKIEKVPGSTESFLSLYKVR